MRASCAGAYTGYAVAMPQTLVGLWALLLGFFGVAQAHADTLVLREPDLTLEGRVVAESSEAVEFAVPLFEYVPAERRRAEEAKWRAEVLRVPRRYIAELTREERPLPRSRPTGEDTVEDRLEAASQYLAAGRENVLDAARQLYREVLEEVGEAPADEEEEAEENEDCEQSEARRARQESRQRAAEGMLRFRLRDILTEWRLGDEDEREALLEELTRYRKGYRVAFELVTVRILNVTWRLAREARTREQMVEQLQAALVEKREQLLEFVARAAEQYRLGSWSEERLAGFQRDFAERRRTLEALVHHPGAVDALAATRRYGSWVEEVRLLKRIAPRAFGEDVGERLRLRIGQDTGVWRNRIRAEHVVEQVDQREDETGAVLAEDNESVREANEALLRDAEASVRETLRAINEYRELLGLRRLVVNPMLMRAAQSSAERFRRNRRMDHDLGGSPLQRARRAGFAGSRLGENLYRSENREAAVDEVLSAWQESPEHHAHLVRKDFRAVGLGQARYYWCLMLGDGR